MTSREFAKLLRRRTFVENNSARIFAGIVDVNESKTSIRTKAEKSVEAAEILAEELEKSGGVSWTMEDAQ